MTTGWRLLLIVGAKDLANLTPSLDPVPILMYALPVVMYVGGTALML